MKIIEVELLAFEFRALSGKIISTNERDSSLERSALIGPEEGCGENLTVGGQTKTKVEKLKIRKKSEIATRISRMSVFVH